MSYEDEQGMSDFQEAMNALYDAQKQYVEHVAKQLGVDYECASDVMYLRTRSRHTQELENELIRLHKAGTPPNIMEF